MNARSGNDRRDEGHPPADEGLSEEELAAHGGEAIPDRTALSTVSSDVAIPVDPAVAADVLSGLVGDEAEELEGADPDA